MLTLDRSLLRKIKILYVEDEIEIQQATMTTLTALFQNVVAANNGKEALELFQEHGDFDIVVTDINMPIMNGLELIEHVKQEKSSFPVVIISAHTDIDFFQKAIDFNVNGYILKPVDIKRLVETIFQAVEGRVLRKELEVLNSNLINKVKEKTYELNSILNSQDNIVIVSHMEKIHTVNKKLLTLLEKDNIEIFNKEVTNICELFIDEIDYFYKDDFQEFCSTAYEKSLNNEDIIVKMKAKDGKFLIFKLNVTTYEFQGTHYVLTLTDITKLQEQASLLQYQANHDPLTKLYNRQKFNGDLEIELTRFSRYKNPFSVAMFDIDFFKKINDTYGHDIGDEVLVNISALAEQSLRETDTIARWGGEEFMILLRETSLKNGFQTMDKLRKTIENTVLSDKLENPITCSFGITECKENEDINSILKRVDVALYNAKNNGRNTVEIV